MVDVDGGRWIVDVEGRVLARRSVCAMFGVELGTGGSWSLADGSWQLAGKGHGPKNEAPVTPLLSVRECFTPGCSVVLGCWAWLLRAQPRVKDPENARRGTEWEGT
jgi:hypothetical protein